MELLAAIIIAPLLTGYLSSFLSRLSLRRNRPPSWLIVPLGIAMGVVATWVVIFQKDLFHPSRWSSKVDGPFMLALTGVPAVLLAAAVQSGRERQKEDPDGCGRPHSLRPRSNAPGDGAGRSRTPRPPGPS